MPPPERRAQPRYAPTYARPVALEWLVAGSPFKVPAQLRDASLMGALVSVDVPPPPTPRTRVKLHVYGAEPPGWAIRAVVVNATHRPPWPWHRRLWRREIRLAFVEPSPFEFFKALLEGFVVEDEDATECHEEGFNPRDWR